MDERENKGDINNIEEPLFRADFADESVFRLPKEWEGVFVDCFGPNPNDYPIIVELLETIAAKYREHNAFPYEYDGISVKDKSMTCYDDPKYYVGGRYGNPLLDKPKYANYLPKKSIQWLK